MVVVVVVVVFDIDYSVDVGRRSFVFLFVLWFQLWASETYVP